MPLATLVDLAKGERLLFALSAAPDTRLLVSSSVGYGFVCKLSDLVSRQRAGKAFLTVEEGALPLPPVTVSGGWVAATADNGKLLVFALEEMKELGGGKGVQVMKLEDKERLTALACFDGSALNIEGKTRTGRPAQATLAGAALEKYRLHRARKGAALEKVVLVERMAGKAD